MEREVLDMFAMRLLAGQRAYGLLREDKKDWAKESLEECLDNSVYQCAEMIRQMKKR